MNHRRGGAVMEIDLTLDDDGPSSRNQANDNDDVIIISERRATRRRVHRASPSRERRLQEQRDREFAMRLELHNQALAFLNFGPYSSPPPHRLQTIHPAIQPQLPIQQSYEELLQLQERIGNVEIGLTRAQLHRLPKSEFKGSGDPQCSVCLSDFEMKDKLTILVPCLHRFHSSCINTWLKKKKTCPVCRETVTV